MSRWANSAGTDALNGVLGVRSGGDTVRHHVVLALDCGDLPLRGVYGPDQIGARGHAAAAAVGIGVDCFAAWASMSDTR